MNFPETYVIIVRDSKAAYWTWTELSPNSPINSLIDAEINSSLTGSESPYKSKEKALMLACLCFQSA